MNTNCESRKYIPSWHSELSKSHIQTNTPEIPCAGYWTKSYLLTKLRHIVIRNLELWISLSFRFWIRIPKLPQNRSPKGWRGRAQRVFKAVELLCMIQWWIRVIIHLFTFVECTTPRVSVDAHGGLRVLVMRHLASSAVTNVPLGDLMMRRLCLWADGGYMWTLLCSVLLWT